MHNYDQGVRETKKGLGATGLNGLTYDFVNFLYFIR